MIRYFILGREHLGSRLARRLIVAVAVFSLLVTVILTSVEVYGQYRVALRGLDHELQRLPQVYLQSLSQSLWVMSRNNLAIELQGLVHLPNIAYAEVHGSHQEWAVAGIPPSHAFLTQSYRLVHPFRGQSVSLGILTVTISLGPIYHRLAMQALAVLGTNLLQTFFTTGFAFALFYWLVNRHLQRMATYVRNFDVTTMAPALVLERHPGANDELDELANAINHMRERTLAAHSALQVSEQQFQLATEAADVGLWDWEIGSPILYLSPVLKQQLGYGPHEVPDRYVEWESRLHPDDRAHTLSAIRNCLSGETAYYEAEYRLRHRDQRYCWFLSRGALQRDAAGHPQRLLGVQVDITKRREAEETLGRLAHFDALTGLPNRLLFGDRLEQAMIESDRGHRQIGVAFLDIDRFKNINDTLGHEAGDQLLKAVAERLQGAVRKGDTVARLSGDEFTLVLAGIARSGDAARVAQKILDVFAKPFHVANRELYMTASLGISLYPDDMMDLSGLLRAADVAMYRAKEKGRNIYQLYSADMMAQAVENMALEGDLRAAVERHELTLYYQPIVRCANGEIIGMEALVRWRHPTRGLMAPLEFIPLAEETGLILPIGEWVLHKACEDCRAWQEELGRPLQVAVNLSARQFEQPHLVHMVQKTLSETGLAPGALTLELTESLLLREEAGKLATLRTLSEMGITLAIDDFGTGYSSLSYLRRFPFRALKIDQSFTRDIPSDPGSVALARAIVQIAHTLGLKTVAEGVETRAQFDFFRGEGSDATQGYYFSRPVPAQEFRTLLREGLKTNVG